MFSNMASLDARLSTFDNAIPPWPLDDSYIASPESLADEGFFYSPTQSYADRVVCHWCGTALHQWQRDDTPRGEHRKHAPHCALVTAGDGVAPGSKAAAAAAAASASSSSKKAASGHSAKQAAAVPESAFERLLKRRASRRLKSAGAASSASENASQPSAESLRATSRQHILRSLFVRELLFSTLTSDQSSGSSDSGAGVELEYAPSNERKKP